MATRGSGSLKGVTSEIAAAVSNFTVEPRCEGELFHRARNAVVDSVAVAVAGGGDEGYRIAQEASLQECAPGPSTLLSGGATTPAMAAFLNGYAIHALDYDDISDTMFGHPSAVLVPALLAVAESVEAPLQRVLESFAVGYDAACAVAEALVIRPHYSSGWHSTSTVGVVGAAAGLAYLLALDEVSVANALGVAATSAAGSRQHFGTMTKSFHAAHAARDAVVAVQLAQHGFTADAASLEGDLGYFRLFGGAAPAAVRLPAGDERNDLLAQGLYIKRYPCCYGTHRIADAARSLFGRVSVDQVDEIRVTVQPHGLDPLIHHRPATGTEAKFSGEFVVAAGLIDGEIGMSTFSEDRVGAPDVQMLLRKVRLAEAAAPPVGPADWKLAFGVVEVDASGETHVQRADHPSHDGRGQLDDSEIDAKFLECFAFAGRADGEQVLANLRQVDLSLPMGRYLTHA